MVELKYISILFQTYVQKIWIMFYKNIGILNLSYDLGSNKKPTIILRCCFFILGNMSFEMKPFFIL